MPDKWIGELIPKRNGEVRQFTSYNYSGVCDLLRQYLAERLGKPANAQEAYDFTLSIYRVK